MKRGMVPLEAVLWIFRIIVTIVALIGVVVVTREYLAIRVESAPNEGQILAQRFLTDPSLAYEDSFTGKVEPFVLDFNKFTGANLNETEKRLKENMQIGEEHAAAKIRIHVEAGYQDVYYKRELYNKLSLLAKGAFLGRYVYEYPYYYPIVVKRDEKIIPGRAEITVLLMR